MTHVLIAGAGIGGLTAALALARAGTDVTLVERASALREAGAGVQLSPNATRILSRLGILERLEGRTFAATGVRIRNGRSGRLIAFLPLADARPRWGAPYLVAHRTDLQSSLAEAVASEPAISLHLGSQVAGFGTDETSVRTTVKQGSISSTFESDALIAADGIRSTIRTRLACEDDRPLETGRTVWRALVGADQVEPSYRDPETNLWLGANAHLVHYPVDRGRWINVVAIIGRQAGSRAEDWSARGDAATIQARFRLWNGEARRLIANASDWVTWPLVDKKPLAAWNAGRVALLGDAAHPILPFLAQGAAQAIEDAAALSAAIGTLADVPAALASYSRNRMSRVARVQQTSRRLGHVYHLAGPAATVRDTTMRLLGGRRLIERYDWLYDA